MDETRRVVEALMHVGPRLTDISRATGIPISTIRYILFRKLPKLGLSVRAHVDYGALGLQRYLIELKSDHPPHYISRLLDLMGETMYLDYYTYSMNERKFIVTFAIPPDYERSFLEFLKTIELFGIIEIIEIKKVLYMRLLPFMVDLFDFSKGVWVQDWMFRQISREVPEVFEHPNKHPNIHEIDLMILAELQKQVLPLRYNYLARKFRLTRQTISKHYKHIRSTVRLFTVIWVPFSNPELVVTPLIIKVDYEPQIREKIIGIPFTYAEMRDEDNTYFAMLLIPSIGFYNTLRFLTKFMESAELNFQDMEYSAKFSIHYQLFRNKSWMNPFEKGIQNLLEIAQKKKY